MEFGPYDVTRLVFSLYHNCDATTTRLRRKIDMFIFCLRRIGSRRARYVVVGSLSYRSRIAIVITGLLNVETTNAINTSRWYLNHNSLCLHCRDIAEFCIAFNFRSKIWQNRKTLCVVYGRKLSLHSVEKSAESWAPDRPRFRSTLTPWQSTDEPAVKAANRFSVSVRLRASAFASDVNQDNSRALLTTSSITWLHAPSR